MLGVAGIPAFVMLVSMAFFVPESPRYLVQTGKSSAARSVLRKLRGQDADVDTELREIESTVAEQLSLREQFRLLCTPSISLMLLYGCSLQAFQQLTGVNTAM